MEQLYHQTHDEIVTLFDLADELTDTTDDARALYLDEQVDVLEPLVDAVHEIADELSQGFVNYATAENKDAAKSEFTFRGSFDSLFKKVNECMERVAGLPAEVAENISVVIQPAIGKLVNHAGKVFTSLKAVVERGKDYLRQQSEEFHEMVARESHLANLMQQWNGVPSK